MDILIDITLRIISHLPKVCSWWLYKPERTTENIYCTVSAREGSVELYCDRQQSNFSIWVDVRNNNSFPIEIDRAKVSGHIHSARLTALNLFGLHLKKGESKSLILRGKIDEPNRELVNKSPENEPMRVELKAVIINKYHTIRDFSFSFERLMCKLINKKAPSEAG